MTSPPDPPACWVERVQARHDRQDEIFASSAAVPLVEYRRDVHARIRSLVAEPELRIRLTPDRFRAFLEEQRWKTLFHGVPGGGLQSLSARRVTERLVLGIRDDAPPDERPAYGYLAGADESHDDLRGYGPVVIHLSGDARDRTSVTLGDSLGATAAGTSATLAAAPVDDATWMCRHAEVDMFGADAVPDATRPFSEYAEVQIYEFGIRDIAYVSFTQQEIPAADLTQLLRALEIRVRLVEEVA